MTPLRRTASWVTQHELLRERIRVGAAFLLAVRGAAIERFGGPRPLRNVYAATTQKAGSQWSKALFGHDLVRAATRMETFPQFRYDEDQFRRRFPAGCFVPGLYLSYPAYSAIHKPRPYSTFYIARDPREIVVSWYFSVRDTHRPSGSVPSLRATLRSLSLHDGLLFSIEELAQPLLGMGTWIDVPEPEVAFFRLEDIDRKPEMTVRQLLKHCGVELAEADLRRVLSETSREALQVRDLEQRTGGESHYRLRRSGYRQHFTKAHYTAFRTATGDLVERLGYSWS